ncbi:MAG: hypothetical protein AVDCRST_MAG17-2007, partial [uncultured Solirubrobacterales bacterium]
LRGPDAPVTLDSPPENQGLPLDVVRALRGAPKGLLWDSPHDNRSMRRVKKLAEGLEGEESDDARSARRVLARYAHDLYEPGNRELIAELGWDTDSFIRSAAVSEEPGDLDRLDDLLTSRASPLELAFLHSALGTVAGGRTIASETKALLARRPTRRRAAS